MQEWVRNRALIWLGVVGCLAFLLPNHYSPWLSFHQELGMALAFVPLLLWAAVRGNAVPALAYGAGALSLVPLLQIATGQLYYAGDGCMGALYLLGFAFAVHAGFSCVGQAGKTPTTPLVCLTPLWLGLVFAGLLSVGIAAHQWLMLGKLGVFVVDMPPNYRPFANLAQPNQLATLLLLGIAGLAFLWEAGRLRAAATLAGVLMLVFGLVMTGSRSVLLALLWLLPAYALLRRRSRLRTTPGALALVIGFYLLLSISWASLNEALLLPSGASTGVDRMAEPGIRKVFWMSMADAISRAPWSGYGWGQIGVAQTATALDYPATNSFFDSSHNVMLDLALWNGLPVALLTIAGLAFWFTWQVRRCADPLAWVTLVAIGMVLSHAMVEYPLNYAYFLLPVGLWMGALSALCPLPFDGVGQRWPGRLRVAVSALGALVLLLFVAVAVQYPAYEADWRLMRFQEARIGDFTPTEAPPSGLLTNLHEFMRFARTPAAPGMSPQDLDGLRKVSERYAYASTMYRYAMAQALNSEPQGAQQTLRRLCKMQTPVACKDAERQWIELAGGRYPRLASVPFPDSPGK